MDKLSKEIKKIRKENELTAKELASKVKCSESFIRQLENLDITPISESLINKFNARFKINKAMFTKAAESRNKKRNKYYSWRRDLIKTG